MYITYSHQKVPCLTVFLFQENKSFGRDVCEVVSGTIYFLWCSGTQAAYGQQDADNGADKGGNGKEKGLKVVLRQHANCLDLTKSDAKEGIKVVLRQHANCLD
jgi:hypothetical protein